MYPALLAHSPTSPFFPLVYQILMLPALWIVNLIGSVAAVCTTIAFVPQLARVYRRKTARDISFTMFLVFSIGELLWLIYGIFIHSMPVILANAVTLGLALAILGLKLRYDRL